MAGLTAFTNAPGTHYRNEHIVGRFVGKLFCGHYEENLIDGNYAVEMASKWVPTPGYSGCTDWARSVRKITNNDPAIARRLVHQWGICEGTDVITDYQGPITLLSDFPLGTVPYPNQGWDNGQNESITKALNNLTEHYAGIGNDLAQARQTCDMFASVALRGAQFIKAMREKQWKQAAEIIRYANIFDKSVQRRLADIWLEFSYGWKPLASDLYEAQLLAHQALSKPLPVMARGNGSSSGDRTFDLRGGEAKATSHYKSTHRTYLEANVTNPYLHTLSSAGLINPLSIAWEVVPFSFVVDWFIPVGATLQAITAGVGLSLNKGYTSSHETWQTSVRQVVHDHAPGEDYWAYMTSGNLQETGFQFRRQCHASFPSPRLYADVTPYSTPRALNALALLRQIF